MDREISIDERRRRRNKKIMRLSIASGILIASVASIFYFSRNEIDRKQLIVATVDRGNIEPSVTASGIIVPAFEEMVICPINSQILEVLHHSGDAVEEGTPLLRLDTQTAQTQYQLDADKLQMQYNISKHYTTQETYASLKTS